MQGFTATLQVLPLAVQSESCMQNVPRETGEPPAQVASQVSTAGWPPIGQPCWIMLFTRAIVAPPIATIAPGMPRKRLVEIISSCVGPLVCKPPDTPRQPPLN